MILFVAFYGFLVGEDEILALPFRVCGQAEIENNTGANGARGAVVSKSLMAPLYETE